MALNEKKSGFGFDMEEKFSKVTTDTDTHTHTATDKHTDAHAHTDTEVKETKSKRTYGMIEPSKYNKIVAYAKANDTSYNDIVNTLLDEFIARHGL